MADGGTIIGGLTKLTLEAYFDAACTRPTGENKIVVPINPKSYSQRMGVKYTEDEAIGGGGQAKVLHREAGEDLTLALIFDGTGTVPGVARRSVSDQVHELRQLGLRLRPPKTGKGPGETNYLKISWGALLFKCRLISLSLDYTLFNPDGMPLRAAVAAKFADAGAGSKSERESPGSDGRVVTLGAGDSLSSLCAEAYGDPGLTVEVARANGLDGFRIVAAGAILFLPPLARFGR
jgi:hypothetical protein